MFGLQRDELDSSLCPYRAGNVMWTSGTNDYPPPPKNNVRFGYKPTLILSQTNAVHFRRFTEFSIHINTHSWTASVQSLQADEFTTTETERTGHN
jgi:hypothetical protein